MESIFVTENPININFFVNECNEVQKLKIGEIFQLKDSSLSLCCTHCLQEFQYFTEFSLHIQEHYLRGEVAQLQEMKDGTLTKSYEEITSSSTNHQFRLDTKDALNQSAESEFFDENLKLVNEWADDQLIADDQCMFEPEINVDSGGKLHETQVFNEGTDYDKLNGIYRCYSCDHETNRWEDFRDHLQTHSNEKSIFCPLCSKGFSAISYVSYLKHSNRIKSTQK